MVMKKLLLQLLIFNLLYEVYHITASNSRFTLASDRDVATNGAKNESTAQTLESKTSRSESHRGSDEEITELLRKLALDGDESQPPESENIEHKTITQTSDRENTSSGRKITNFDQVGGHQGLKKDVDGFLLKPKFYHEEIEFYEDIARSENATLSEIKPYLPQYDGTKIIDGASIKYIRLRNIIEDYVSPCIMDIKMGFQIWDPTSTTRKIEKRKKTYVAMRNQFHFCIQGFQYADLLNGGETVKRRKADLKFMLPEEGIKTLYNFVNGELGLKTGLVRKILEQLKDIASWFEHQKEYNFYASSIFLTYDCNCLNTHGMVEGAGGDTVTNETDDDDPENTKVVGNELKVRVRMIDFDHALHSTDLDTNYLGGLRRLIKVFENLHALHKNPQLLNILFPIEEKIKVAPPSM